jgi:hypothetical protein
MWQSHKFSRADLEKSGHGWCSVMIVVIKKRERESALALLKLLNPQLKGLEKKKFVS